MIDADIRKQGITVRSILNAYSVVYRKAFLLSADKRTDAIQYALLEVARAIYAHCASKQVQWDNLLEFNELVEESTAAFVDARSPEVCARWIYLLEDVCNGQLDLNSPWVDDIAMFQFRSGRGLGGRKDWQPDQWRHVSSGYLQMIANMGTRSIEQDYPEPLSSVFSALNGVIMSVLDSRLAPEQKSDVIRNVLHRQGDLGRQAIWKGLLSSERFLCPFHAMVVRKVLESAATLAGDVISTCAQLAVDGARGRPLTRRLIDGLFVVLRFIAKDIGNGNVYERTVTFIVQAVGLIRKGLPRRPGERDQDCLYLHETIRHNETWYKRNGARTKAVDAAFRAAIQAFRGVDAARRRVARGTVEWRTPQLGSE